MYLYGLWQRRLQRLILHTWRHSACFHSTRWKVNWKKPVISSFLKLSQCKSKTLRGAEDYTLIKKTNKKKTSIIKGTDQNSAKYLPDYKRLLPYASSILLAGMERKQECRSHYPGMFADTWTSRHFPWDIKISCSHGSTEHHRPVNLKKIS